MRSLIYPVIIPGFLIIVGLALLIYQQPYGLLIAAVGGVWMLLSFLIGYKEHEEFPMGMGRGRKR